MCFTFPIASSSNRHIHWLHSWCSLCPCAPFYTPSQPLTAARPFSVLTTCCGLLLLLLSLSVVPVDAEPLTDSIQQVPVPPDSHVGFKHHAAPRPLGPYVPKIDDTRTYECDHSQNVLFVNNYVEGFGNWFKAFINVMYIASRTGRAVVEPCMLHGGAVACSFRRLIDDADPTVGYARAFNDASDVQHVFPMSYQVNFTRNAAKMGVKVLPYKQFMACAVARQQAERQRLPLPRTAGPPTERLQLPTLLHFRYRCDKQYSYTAPSSFAFFTVSDDIEATRCAHPHDVAAAAGVLPVEWCVAS